MIFASPFEAERVGDSMNRSIKFTMVAFVALGFDAQAQAGADCYLRLECPDDELCINTVCTAPEEPLDECSGNEACEDRDTTCDDGFCKRDGVYCENPAGRCYVESTRSSCGCEDGMGMDGISAPGAEAPTPTDEELYAECQETLISGCGEEAPDISDECTDEQLSLCTDMFERLNALLQACGEEPEELGYRRLASCCRDVDDEDFQEVYGCITALESDDCEGFEACAPDATTGSGAPAGVSDSREGDSDQGDWVGDGAAGTGADDEEATLGTPRGADDSTDGEGAHDADDDDGAHGADDDDGADDSEDDKSAADAEADDSGCAVAPALGSGSAGLMPSIVFALGLLLVSRVTRRRLE